MIRNTKDYLEDANAKEYLFRLKAVAIFSTIAAHCTLVDNQLESNYIAMFSASVLASIGSIGVPLFLVISGYLYNNSKELKTIIKNKIESICIPWFFWGTLVWLYIVLRKGGITLESWGNFLIGNGSYLYFNTILLFMFAVFYWMRNSRGRYVLLLMSIVMVTYQSLILKSYSNYTYLNPLIWCGWFSLGQILRNVEVDLNFVFKYRFLWYIMYLLITLYMSYTHRSIGYWSPGAIVVELVAIFVCMNLAKRGGTFLGWIGRRTYLIYLLHMSVAGIISNMMNRFSFTAVITILRPVIVISLTVIGIHILENVFRCQKNKKISIIMGIKY